MIYTANVPETDPAIAAACARFAAQITPILPMDRMAIVLLEPEGDTSRVVYSWADPALSRRSLEGPVRVGSKLPQTAQHPLRIPINGQDGLLGEVLVRGCGPDVHDSSSGDLARQCAGHLALALENIALRRRLDDNLKVSSAVQRITKAASPEAPISRVFRHFAGEVNGLVEFQRLSIYFVSQESDLAIFAYRTGQGAGHRRSGESAKLSDSGLGQSVIGGQSQIFSDLSESGCPVVWNQVLPSEMRSALLVPVPHHGATVGAVLLEHRLPQAYGNGDQTCLEELAAALTPLFAREAFLKWYAASASQPLQDRATLDEPGIPVSSVVQAGRYYRHTRRPADQLHELNRVETAPVLAGHLPSLIKALAGQMASIGQAEWSAVFIYDHHASVLIPIAGADINQEGPPEDFPEDLPGDLSEEIADLAAKCFEEGAPARRSLDLRSESEGLDHYPQKGHLWEFPQVQTWKCLAIPLRNSVEKAGVLVFGRDEEISWTNEEVCLLEAFVGEAANEIEVARLKDAGRGAGQQENGRAVEAHSPRAAG